MLLIKEVDPTTSAPLPEDAIPAPMLGSGLDNLLGLPLEGYEEKYWDVVPGDNTKAGFWLSGAGIRVPKTIHIPTGSKVSYRKILLVLVDGSKIPAWEKHADIT